MKVGLNLPVMAPGLDRSTLLEWARRIDTGPFSSLFCGARVSFANPEILETLAAAAAVTERVSTVPGTDEVMLVPTTTDPDELHHVADILG